MKKIMGMLLIWFCMAGLSWGQTLGDVNNDGAVGLPEAIYALQVSAGVRPDLPMEDINVLITHQASGGSFVDLGNGLYRLTLNNVVASAGYSAKQPEQVSGNTTTRAVINEYPWDASNPPPAAVVITDPAVPITQNVMLARFMHPVYDESLAKLTFYAQIETNYQGENLTQYVADADSSLPASFGQVSVALDLHWPFSCGRGYIQCYRHYGCCNNPVATEPTPRFKVSKCWSWSWMKCRPCHDDECAKNYPKECGQGDCYIDCLDDRDACDWI
jgi:hypothetical protein